MTSAIQAPLVRLLATVTTTQHVANPSKSFAARVTAAPSPASGGRRFAVAASRSTKDEANSNSNSKAVDDPASQDDDVSFLLKLGGGSVAGAAAIKYGSILVPEITRPNIIQALIMISTPVIVALLILIKQSRVN
ncbi:hypothetical protein SSX86_002306 [Deinandra increscens subsp. villosa]|uniref:Uncharacterized protein n=1 Tax=Deinandra increscens subsp. villosa TaxID=3103831 RepID=A0AAP0DW50_9ASTR